jgi:TPR repeat protein
LLAELSNIEHLLPDGVTRDPKDGIKWLNISARHGCLDAIFYLSSGKLFYVNNIEEQLSLLFPETISKSAICFMKIMNGLPIMRKISQFSRS